MSKIQEALKRIHRERTGAPPISPNNTAATDSLQVGTLRRKIVEDPIAEARIEGRLIEVDRDRLRDAGLLAPEDQARYMADQYRLIKRPILNNLSESADHAMNLIMVASALPGDGKTFNCINLALSIATEKDKSVLLVDADVAKPHISRLFDIDEEPGLIDLLVADNPDPGGAIITSDVPGLSVLPAGRSDTHATELLASKRMARLCDWLSKEDPTRVIIFDSPPILATSESRVLASRMGQIAMVVSSGHTPQHAVMEALESLDHSKAINLILNRAVEGFGADGFGNYGYGYGYRSTEDSSSV